MAMSKGFDIHRPISFGANETKYRNHVAEFYVGASIARPQGLDVLGSQRAGIARPYIFYRYLCLFLFPFHGLDIFLRLEPGRHDLMAAA